MSDFQYITSICEENSRLESNVVDNFLLAYSDFRNRTSFDMDRRLKAFRKVAKTIQEEYVNMFRAQYMAHRIFRQNGLLRKYLNHSDLKELPIDERAYLENQLANPWKFSFAIIKNQPSKDFFEMWDVFTEEEYLLYSPGITTTLEERKPILWFNLIAFNGYCWQTYGPIIGYSGFTPDDIFFFATELRPGKYFDSDEAIYKDIEADPVPYMMLMTGSAYPLTFRGKDVILHLVADYETARFDLSRMKEHFKINKRDGIFRFSLKGHEEGFPYSNAYYDEKMGRVLLYSMTDRGFEELATTFNHYGFNFDEEPDIRVTLNMYMTAERILEKSIVLNPYEEIFSDNEEVDKETSEGLKRANHFLSLVMEDVNEGRTPDIGNFAAQAGLETDEAWEIYNIILEKFNSMGKRGQ